MTAPAWRKLCVACSAGPTAPRNVRERLPGPFTPHAAESVDRAIHPTPKKQHDRRKITQRVDALGVLLPLRADQQRQRRVGGVLAVAAILDVAVVAGYHDQRVFQFVAATRPPRKLSKRCRIATAAARRRHARTRRSSSVQRKQSHRAALSARAAPRPPPAHTPALCRRSQAHHARRLGEIRRPRPCP